MLFLFVNCVFACLCGVFVGVCMYVLFVIVCVRALVVVFVFCVVFVSCWLLACLAPF